MACSTPARCTARQGDGIRHAAVDRHGRRPVRQRHGRERRRRVQDRARPAARALPGSEGPGTGDVPAGLAAGTRSVRTGPRATGHRNGPKPSITQTKRRKPPHYKSGTKKQAISPAPRQTATLPRYGQNNDGRANLAGGQHAHRQSALMSPHRRHQDCGSRISVVKAPSSKLRLR